MNYEGRKQVMLRVRREYFDAIVSGEKKEELRRDSKKWAWLLRDDPPDVARFVCGQDTHLRKIKSIYRGDAEEVLGRPPSAQGRKDLGFADPVPGVSPGDWTPTVIVIELDFSMGLCNQCGGLMWRGFKRSDGTPDDTLDWFGCDKCEKTHLVFKVSRGRIPIK
jgi:hypothetical protein